MRATRLSVLAPVVAALLLTGATADDRVIRITVSAPGRAAVTAGQAVDVQVEVRDPASGFGLGGAMPAVWFVPDDGDAGDGRCERLVNRLSAAATPPADSIDLNGFDIVQASADGTVALVDPVFNLASANIRAIARLGAAVTAWDIDDRGAAIAAGVADRAELRLIDGRTLEPRRTVALAAPVAGLQRAGDAWWAGLTDGTLARVADDGAVASFPVGIGAVAVYRATDGVLAVAPDGGLTWVDARRGVRHATIAGGVGAGVYVARADAVFALSSDGRRLATLTGDDFGNPRWIDLAVPGGTIAADPGQAWLAITARDAMSVAIVDVARGRLRWTVAVDDPIVAAAFSDNFLYLMHQRRGGASRVVFDPAGGPPAVVAIAAGADRDDPQQPSVLPLMARVPSAGMLVASRRDRRAYMIADDNAQAAMSSLPLRAGDPLGILLRARGLASTGQRGRYAARTVFPAGGRYIAVARLAQPALAHCSAITVRPASGTAARVAATASPLPERQLVVPGTIPADTAALSFAVTGTPAPRLAGAMLVGSDWQLSPTDIRSTAQGFTMPVDVRQARGFTLFVRLREGAREQILSAPVRVTP